jgi:hypothetical protein
MPGYSRTDLLSREDRHRGVRVPEPRPVEALGALSDRANAVLQMQQRHGNQFVLRRLVADRQLQRQEADDDQANASASSSMVGDAAGWLGDMLGLKSVPGKIKQGVNKARQTANQGIDWTIDKVRGGAKQLEDWVED